MYVERATIMMITVVRIKIKYNYDTEVTISLSPVESALSRYNLLVF